MNVTRVRTASGSHIEPPLQDDWSELQKLEWHAAVAEADTGVRVLVHPMRSRLRLIYSIQVGNSSMSAMPYRDAWTYINGVIVGVEQLQRQAQSRSPSP